MSSCALWKLGLLVRVHDECCLENCWHCEWFFKFRSDDRPSTDDQWVVRGKCNVLRERGEQFFFSFFIFYFNSLLFHKNWDGRVYTFFFYVSKWKTVSRHLTHLLVYPTTVNCEFICFLIGSVSSYKYVEYLKYFCGKMRREPRVIGTDNVWKLYMRLCVWNSQLNTNMY